MEKPILFSTEMVKAILEGRKTQTRRVIKPQPLKDADLGLYILNGVLHVSDQNLVLGEDLGGIDCYYSNYIPTLYQPGDILWVRETWADLRGMGFEQPFKYLANCLNKNGEEDGDIKRCRLDYGVKWRPSIHMPREAARIFLQVKNVRVERLQEITEEDAVKEGCIPLLDKDGVTFISAKGRFHALWDSIYAKRGYGWDVNPWVWVIKFEMAS